MSLSKIALLICIGCLSSNGFSSEASMPASDKLSSKNGSFAKSELLAEAKVRKKSKSKRGKGDAAVDESSSMSESSPTSAAPGKTMHKAQEGTDKPYKWHAALTSSLSRNESQTGESKSGTGNYNLHLLAAYIISSSIEVGPNVVYSEQTTKYEDGDPTVVTSYDAGLAFAYNLGNLDKSVFVPFVKLGFAMSSVKTKVGDKETKGSGTKLIVGGGVHYFVDSNVALTGELAYAKGSKKFDGAKEATKTTDLDLLNLGLSLFL